MERKTLSLFEMPVQFGEQEVVVIHWRYIRCFELAWLARWLIGETRIRNV